ncbi:MAG: hypothetical protein RIM72_16315 [Alphaproteobacteria bacterium]
MSRLGSYLGKCIIETYGGSWQRIEGDVCVAFDNRSCVFPFAKIAKHLENGREDSVHSFFTLLPIVFEKVLRERTEAAPQAGAAQQDDED